jgi:hypothetical protein
VDRRKGNAAAAAVAVAAISWRRQRGADFNRQKWRWHLQSGKSGGRRGRDTMETAPSIDKNGDDNAGRKFHERLGNGRDGIRLQMVRPHSCCLVPGPKLI